MEWLINNPVVVVAIIAIITVAFKAIYWIVSVDKDQASLKTSADSDRSVLRDFMKEIREDIKKYLSGYLLLHSRKIVRFD